MTASKVQLIGGKFQDPEGNLLINGYLLMVLSQDGTVAGVGSICSGIEIKIQLDSSASVSTSPTQSVWGNDAILPVNTYYKVTGYTAAGQPAWGPNIQQVVGAGPFDVGTWIPNQVISWVPPLTSVTLQNNGTLNSSQQLLNLESTDSSVIITDLGGGNINLQSGGGTEFDTPGDGWFFGGQSYGEIVEGNGNLFTDNTVFAVQLMLEAKWAISAVRAYVITGGSGFATAGLYSADGNTKIIDMGTNAISFAGSQRLLQTNLGSPVTLDPGIYWFAFGRTTGSAGSLPNHTIYSWVNQLLNGLDLVNLQTGVTRYGIAANGLVGGGSAATLPPTLGAMTPLDHTNNSSIPAIMFVV